MPSIDEIRRIRAEVEGDLLQRPGVTGVDVGNKYTGGRDTGTLAIRVYVARKQDVPEGRAIPSEIRGVPTDVIERTFVLH